MALIEVEAVDAQGERCPTFQQRVDFDWPARRIWRGGYNSGKTNSINNRFLDLECGINRVAVRSTPVPGAITVTARCRDLKPATLALTSGCVMVDHGFSAALPALPPPPALAKTAGEDLLILAQARPQPPPGRFLKTFSYSGPTGAVQVRQGARDGEKIYADREFVFTALPAPLKGSDWVQAANADKLYSAADLMELAAGVDGVVYVAHDERLPRPDWLQRNFKSTDLRLTVNSQTMNIFERRVRSGESLTLGSNTEDRRLKASNMYIVFVTRAEAGSRASL